MSLIFHPPSDQSCKAKALINRLRKSIIKSMTMPPETMKPPTFSSFDAAERQMFHYYKEKAQSALRWKLILTLRRRLENERNTQ